LDLYTYYGFGCLVYKGFSVLLAEGFLESEISIAFPQFYGKLAMGVKYSFRMGRG
jgi:hypothetical protein